MFSRDLTSPKTMILGIPMNLGMKFAGDWRRSAALPAQDKPNTAMTKRERWAQKEARSLGIGETSQSDENCSSRKDWSKVFLLLYEMLRDVAREIRCANPF
uniref:Uncharacterized protein n=1 Tax=Oryza nivara TaxID=4536 RepID=A0A0E0IRQ1_ORYNI